MANLMYKYGCKKDPIDERDFKFSGIVKPKTLPPMVDLSSTTYIPKIFDQQTLGSCTSNAIGNCYLFVRNKQGEIDPDYIPSRLFIYFNERDSEGTINEDSGACIRTGIKVLNKYGACHERYCPYLIESFTSKPTKEAYDDGLKFQSLVYKRITNSIIDMKGCLAEGYPFVLGIQLYENFESDIVARTGIVGMPSGKCLGGHAVLAVGYNDAEKQFKIMNSWGDSWGDHGYFYLPYEYLTDCELAMDLWTIRKVE